MSDFSTTHLGPPQISDYDNAWNKLTLAVNRHKLHPSIPPTDPETIARLKQELIAVSRRDGIGWWADS